MPQPPLSESALPPVEPDGLVDQANPVETTASADPEETAIQADPRFQAAVAQFNAGEWYACHDGFEELWHETRGPCRRSLQGILQIAVAQLHLERGNLRGATILLGEGLGRLRDSDSHGFGLDLDDLRLRARDRLTALQQGADPHQLPQPRLEPAV